MSDVVLEWTEREDVDRDPPDYKDVKNGNKTGRGEIVAGGRRYVVNGRWKHSCDEIPGWQEATPAEAYVIVDIHLDTDAMVEAAYREEGFATLDEAMDAAERWIINHINTNTPQAA